MIRLGSTTPASHGSKYTSISCSPRKYHGAFDGFGVLAGWRAVQAAPFRKDRPHDQEDRTEEQRNQLG